MRRKIIDTSTSGLDNHNIVHDIELIRAHIFINNVQFIDGKNITTKRLRYLMTTMNSSAVRTDPSTAEELAEMFHQLYQQGYQELFIISLTSKHSESIKIIQQVADDFKEHMDIYVYDSKDIDVCEAMMALEAEHMTKKGHSMPEIASRLDKLKSSHTMLFAVNDLSYLMKNKKVSSVSGILASIFNIKPILTITAEGKLIIAKKVRSIDKSLEYMVKSLAKRIQGRDCFVYILSTGETQLDNKLINKIKQQTTINYVTVLPLSTVSVANQGPTGVGLCSFIDEIPYAAKFYLQPTSG
ncbi:DegV family protein [Psychrobacter sp. I-STPA10]|uniref:DegV family protein n=1 Tax=Psychrobacter sp. I-STPA10 TaxID=2585769 RepID=UPI001E4AFFB0|nr:DegV family protein [Psychrobacter sp. I-STPA10]